MSCERQQEALSDHAAGAPAPPQLARHLDACAECRSQLLALREALESADASLAELAFAEPSPEFRARLRQHVAAATEPRSRYFFASRWASWLAAAAAVVMAVLLVGRAGSRPAARAVATAPAPAVSPPASTVSGESPSAPGPPAPAARPVAARVLVGRTPARRAPDVIVPPDQQRALADYVALVGSQRASAATLLSAGEPSSELSQPRIEIAPLEIAPLDPAEAQGR